jgi:transposase
MIPEPAESRKPGAQPGHTGHFRIRKRPTERLTVHLDLHECPECHSTLGRKGSRKRIIEDIPVIKPEILEYRLDRLYCSRCHRIYELDIPDALPSATLSLRAMLTVAYFRIGMRMSIENTAATMMNLFGIRISEGGIQNILSQLSDSLGSEYASLLLEIRNAPSRHMDLTSWRIDGNPYNLWTFLTKSEAIFRISGGYGMRYRWKYWGITVAPMYMTGIPHSKHLHGNPEMNSSTAGRTSYAMQRNWNSSTEMRDRG